jgi:serine/threonine protein kinase
MSPELLIPEEGLEARPNEKSDCYALGMVTYEILSGRRPFSPCTRPATMWKVLTGERPGRPEGEEGKLFTDIIWIVLERCWEPRPHNRIEAEAVLLGLEGDQSFLRSDGYVAGTGDSGACF